MKIELAQVKFREPVKDPRASVGHAAELKADGRTVALVYDTEMRLVIATGIGREEKPEVLVPAENVISMVQATKKEPARKTA